MPVYEARPGPQPMAFPSTFPELVEHSAKTFGNKPFLARRHARGGDPVTFEELQRTVRRVAAGLAARGIGPGDRVGIMSENRYEWLLADLGTTYLGAIDVPRGVDTSPAEMHFILEHSGSRFVFVEQDRVAAELAEHRGEMPALEGMCTLQDSTEVDGVTTLPELMAEGDEWLKQNGDQLAEMAQRVQPHDLLTIVYTSGTTADPKGVMLTHENVLSNVRTANEVFGFGVEDRFLSALPPWHMYERMMDYLVFAVGAEIVYTDQRGLKQDLASQRPTVFAAVPRIWEAVHDGIVNKCRKLPPLRRALMQHVLDTCRRVGAGQPKPLDRVLYPLMRATVLKKFSQVTGGRLRVAVSGGGALPAHVDERLLGLGLPISNGYGLTETSPVVSVRVPGDQTSGTIGPPLPETEVQIRDDNGGVLGTGETGIIWIRGPGVMKGYYHNSARTSAVLVDGWFDSGDLGCIDANGKIHITGRAKDTIVLAGGENVEPEAVETGIKVSPLIDQAVVVGQDRKSLGALLVVSEALENEIPRDRWETDGPLVKSEEVRALLRRELDEQISRQNGFRAIERIASFAVLHEPMTPENDCLTATLKIKRHVVADRFGEVIEGLFETHAPA